MKKKKKSQTSAFTKYFETQHIRLKETLASWWLVTNAWKPKVPDSSAARLYAEVSSLQQSSGLCVREARKKGFRNKTPLPL